MGIGNMYTLTPPSERAVGWVDTIDITKRIAHMHDKAGGKFQASFIFTDSSFQIPQQGERWGVIRHGWMYHLDKRMDHPDEHDAKTTLLPGDVVQRVPGTYHIHSKGVQINSQAIGIIKRVRVSLGGSTASYALSDPCVSSASIQVFKDGLLVDPNHVTIDPDNLTLHFSPSLTSGLMVIYYQS